MSSILKIAATAAMLPAFLGAQPLVPYRAWQFHKLDVPYVAATMKLAKDYDVNTVVFSHDMIGYASQLFDGTDRGEKLRTLAREAHSNGLRAWVWVREFEHVPAQFLNGKVVELDRPGIWEWLAARYEEVFAKYPEFDGLMLTFHETQYKIFDPAQVHSALSMPERFAKMINTIDAVCSRHKKDFIVRSFLYEPEEMEWFRQGYAKTGPSVMVETKCEPHDWDPFYPNDSMIGAFPGRKQIVEFDGSAEFFGKNRVPYTQPEYFERRWRYDLSKPGVAGYNLRLDHGGYDSIHTPNEINIYAMYRFTQDSKATGAGVWKEWTRKHYGDAAAAEIEAALKPSFDVVNQAFYALEFWITDHSKLPTFSYADGHLRSRTMAKWYPDDPKYKAMEERLIAPDPPLLEAILREKDEAIAGAERCLQHLQNARANLTPKQYDDLYWRLDLLHRTAIVWKLQAEAFFGFKVLEGHAVPGLRERIERAIAGLKSQAEVSAANPMLGKDPPASAAEIRAVAADLEKRLQVRK